MTTVSGTDRASGYVLGRTAHEYERLRGQARVWEDAAGRVLDQAGVSAGARCLDAGCGPGETMQLLAERAGPAGEVVGLDADPVIGAQALTMLRSSGYRNCSFRAHDLTADEPVPGAPFDLVYARLLLFHLPERTAVLARLWDAVAPGGCLVVQDYDLRGLGPVPEVASFSEALRIMRAALVAAGCDVVTGARLAEIFAAAGAGEPDGTDVAGRIEPLGTGQALIVNTFRSVLGSAVAHGITTEDGAAATMGTISFDATRLAGRPMLWPLLISAWKRKAQG